MLPLQPHLLCFPPVVSSPATMASLLFVELSKHASASGPLYLESPRPGKPSLSPDIHTAHSFISFAHPPFSYEDFSVRHSLSNLLKMISHPRTPSAPSLSIFPAACVTLGHTLYLAIPGPTAANPTHPSKPSRKLRIKQSY